MQTFAVSFAFINFFKMNYPFFSILTEIALNRLQKATLVHEFSQ